MRTYTQKLDNYLSNSKSIPTSPKVSQPFLSPQMKIKNFDFALNQKTSKGGLDLTKNIDLSFLGSESLSTPRDRNTMKRKPSNKRSSKKVNFIDDSAPDALAILDSLKKERIERTDQMIKELSKITSTEQTPKSDVSVILRDINNTIKDIRNLASRSKASAVNTIKELSSPTASKEISRSIEIDESAWKIKGSKKETPKDSSTANLKHKLFTKANQNAATKRLSSASYSSLLPDSNKKAVVQSTDNYDLEEYLPGKNFLSLNESVDSNAIIHPRSKSSANAKENAIDALSRSGTFFSPSTSAQSFHSSKQGWQDAPINVNQYAEQGLERQRQNIKQYVRDIVENDLGNLENLTHGRLVDTISKILVGFLDRLDDNPILNPNQKNVKFGDLLAESRYKPRSINILERVPNVNFAPSRKDTVDAEVQVNIPDPIQSRLWDSTEFSLFSSRRDPLLSSQKDLLLSSQKDILASSQKDALLASHKDLGANRRSYERSSSKQNRIKLLNSDEYPLALDKSMESPNVSINYDLDRSRLGQHRDSRDNSLSYSQTFMRNVSPVITSSVALEKTDTNVPNPLNTEENKPVTTETTETLPARSDPNALRESLMRAEMALNTPDPDQIMPKLTSDNLIAAKNSRHEKHTSYLSTHVSPRSDSSDKYRSDRKPSERYRPYSVDASTPTSKNYLPTSRSNTEERSSSLSKIEKSKESQKADSELLQSKYKPRRRLELLDLQQNPRVQTPEEKMKEEIGSDLFERLQGTEKKYQKGIKEPIKEVPNENDDSMVEERESFSKSSSQQSSGRPFEFSFKGSFRASSSAGSGLNNTNEKDSLEGRASSNFPKKW